MRSNLLDILENDPELPLQPTGSDRIIVDNSGVAKVVKVKRAQIDRLEPSIAPKEYHVKPTFQPVGEALFQEYLGVELEVEVDYIGDSYQVKQARNRAAYLADKALNTVKSDPFCIIKCDGSLKNGFEVCSRPAAIETHRQVWDKFFSELPLNVLAKDTCGMHVHISKEPLSSLQIGKILVFIHATSNRKFIEKIAGRKSCHYSDFSFERPFKHALNRYKNQFAHYSAVNILNPNTVELRIFKSTTDRERFLANLEFCHALVKFTFPGITSMVNCRAYARFIEFVVVNRKFYPHLINFLISAKYIDSALEVKDATKHRKIR